MRPTHLLYLFASGLVLLGIFRWATIVIDDLHELSSAPTVAYIALTVFVVTRIVRSPIGWTGIGFGIPFRPAPHLALGILGAGVAVLTGELVEPLWVWLFGEGRDLSRFDSASTTLPGVLGLIVFSWIFAALGEEFAFRGVLMRGLASALGDSRNAIFFAYALQAVIFGTVHMYQGAAGVAGATLSGLIFGGLVWIARGSLWPAVVAHGCSNTYGILSLWMQGKDFT